MTFPEIFPMPTIAGRPAQVCASATRRAGIRAKLLAW
jgi:hypothetical protein